MAAINNWILDDIHLRQCQDYILLYILIYLYIDKNLF